MCRLAKQVGNVTESAARSSYLSEMEAIGKGEGAHAPKRAGINAALHQFMSTANGISAFAVPRDQFSLTSKIWLRITKETS